jgi:hypothetical protein
MVRRRSWSLLSIMAQGDTWFLDDALTRFFRTLQARGLFRRFTRVIFYGVGPDCGFAACTYARFAPGARVLAAGPVATLDPARAPFERRFRSARRLPFPGPMGFGPAGIATADRALILHDPTEFAPAAHAALYPGRTSRASACPMRAATSPASCRRRRPAIPVLRLLEKGEADTAAVRAALKEACRRNPGTMVRRARAALVQGRPERAASSPNTGSRSRATSGSSALLAEARSGEPDRAASDRSEPAGLLHETPPPVRPDPVAQARHHEGPVPARRRRIRLQLAASTPTWGARSTLLTIRRSERVTPGPFLRGMSCPAAVSIT